MAVAPAGSNDVVKEQGTQEFCPKPPRHYGQADQQQNPQEHLLGEWQPMAKPPNPGGAGQRND
jgi:hypothetical protein